MLSTDWTIKRIVQYLHSTLERYGGVIPILVLAQLIKQQEGEKPATDFIIQQMQQRPYLRILDYWLDLMLSQPKTRSQEHLLLLKEVTQYLLKNKPAYKC